MWARVMVDPAGNPVSVTVNVAVAAVMTLEASLVRKNSMRTVPLAVDSVPPTGGTSLAGHRVDVNTGFGVGVGGGVGVGVVEVFEHPIATAITTRARYMRFMTQTPC